MIGVNNALVLIVLYEASMLWEDALQVTWLLALYSSAVELLPKCSVCTAVPGSREWAICGERAVVGSQFKQAGFQASPGRHTASGQRLAVDQRLAGSDPPASRSPLMCCQLHHLVVSDEHPQQTPK